jgi:hypothetical protein
MTRNAKSQKVLKSKLIELIRVILIGHASISIGKGLLH